MTVATPASARSKPSVASRRFGYFVAATINLAMLYIANNLLEWGWFPWLTEAFEDVLPIVTFSIVVTLLWNLAWIAYDAPWFKSIGNIVQSIIALVVTIRMLQVYPFDFSAYSFNWEAATRTILIIVIVALGVAIVAETISLLTRRGD